MTAEEKARELGYSEWIISHFNDFKKSIELYNLDEMSELMVLFFVPTILFGIDATKQFVEKAKHCGYENRIEYMYRLLKEKKHNRSCCYICWT
jgi:hypothetical protein